MQCVISPSSVLLCSMGRLGRGEFVLRDKHRASPSQPDRVTSMHAQLHHLRAEAPGSYQPAAAAPDLRSRPGAPDSTARDESGRAPPRPPDRPTSARRRW